METWIFDSSLVSFSIAKPLYFLQAQREILIRTTSIPKLINKAIINFDFILHAC